MQKKRRRAQQGLCAKAVAAAAAAAAASQTRDIHAMPAVAQCSLTAITATQQKELDSLSLRGDAGEALQGCLCSRCLIACMYWGVSWRKPIVDSMLQCPVMYFPSEGGAVARHLQCSHLVPPARPRYRSELKSLLRPKIIV
jgi:hypothetical protein